MVTFHGVWKVRQDPDIIYRSSLKRLGCLHKAKRSTATLPTQTYF